MALTIFLLLVSLLSISASPFEETEVFLSRQERSIEGEQCSADNFRCNLAYTACNKETGFCECDRRVSVGMKMPLFPEVVQCIPFEYVNATGLCLPTNPDICSLLVPGSFCDTSKRDGSAGKMKCACKIGGEYPNCIVRVGSVCRNNATCLKDIPDAFCGNITESGFGKCSCGVVEDKGYISNRAGTACKATNCAAKPCKGDVGASICTDSPTGYQCACRNNTKGKSHDFDNEGICCNEHMVTCHDFSRCIKVTELCNGISDCDDCSDEMQLYCTGPLPKKNPRCFRNFSSAAGADTDSAIAKDSAAQIKVPVVLVNPNSQAAIQVAQAAATSGLNNQRLTGLYNPYSAAASILRGSIPSVPQIGIPGTDLFPGK